PASSASLRMRVASAAGSAPAGSASRGAGDRSTMPPSIESASMPAPDFLYSIPALRELEARGSAAAGDPRALMVRAGQAAWRTAREHGPGARRRLGVGGPGNNGGDGFELARNALRAGRQVTVLQWGSRELAGAAAAARAGWEQDGGETLRAGEELPEADLLVDALFGIGLSRAPEGAAERLVRAINRHPAPVLALDVPSGLDAGKSG